MKRVAGLVLAGLVLLLLDVPLTWSQDEDPVCPFNGDQPSVDCDARSNCFHHCCLSSGLCPNSSCVDSLDAETDDRTLCSGRCLDEVACNPFNPDCVPQNAKEHCIGTISCLTANCDGRAAGSVCLYTGVARNFRVCELAE
jgi:hypothetical protein